GPVPSRSTLWRPAARLPCAHDLRGSTLSNALLGSVAATNMTETEAAPSLPGARFAMKAGARYVYTATSKIAPAERRSVWGCRRRSLASPGRPLGRAPRAVGRAGHRALARRRKAGQPTAGLQRHNTGGVKMGGAMSSIRING